MKKSFEKSIELTYKELIDIFVNVIIVTATAHFTYMLFRFNDGGFELPLYAALTLLFVRIFHAIVSMEKMSEIKKKFVYLVLHSVMFTLLIFLANNLHTFLIVPHPECESLRDYIIAFGNRIEHDIAFTEGFGKFRYIFVFFVMVLLCAIDIFIISKSKKNKALKLNELDFSSETFIDDEELALSQLKRTLSGKNELLEYLTFAESEAAYRTLFEDFREFMSDEEIQKMTAQANELFDAPYWLE